VSRTFPCRRCGQPVEVPDAALRDPAASLVCAGCGLRYARKAPGGTRAGASTTSSRYTAQGTAVGPASADAPPAESAPPPADPPTPPSASGTRERTRSLDALPSLRGLVSTYEVGDFVGNRYRIVRLIARGGMGEVYEAEDVELRGRVALKTIRASAAGETPGAIERFKREVQLARRVTHPNVCRIFDVGFDAATPEHPPTVFLTMELLEGETLAERLKRDGRLTVETALPIARQMAEALGAAHDSAVVHRDFKSENVFLVPGSAGDRVVVTDFGIARSGIDESFSPTLTSDGHVIGTPAYMAPEQIEGAEVTGASDQYALGVVLFEMVTGELPFRGDNPIATAARRLSEAPPSPRRFVPDLDPVWEAAILRCLERRPQGRFEDVREVPRALEGSLPAEAPAAVAAPPVPPTSDAPPRSRGERAKRWVAVVLAVGLAGAAYYSWTRLREIRDRVGAEAPFVARRSVAVLEPRNLSGRPESAWLGTALAEMLSSELGRARDIRLVPGETVERALGDLDLDGRERLDADDLDRVRRRLGADFLVLGGYTALGSGGELRLDLRLADARSHETVATFTEGGDESDLFDLVTGLGERLRERLGAHAESSVSALPASPEAARLYAEGLEALRAFDPGRGRELLEQAVAADPGNALARSALATAWSSLGFRARARVEAERALELAGDLPPEERLVVEARYFEMADQPGRAAEAWQRLWSAFPDVVDHGLRLMSARLRSGDPQAALAVAASLRNLPPPDGEDPRIDLGEASAAGALRDFRRELEASERAVARAEGIGADLLVAEGSVLKAAALGRLGRRVEARASLERARELYEVQGDRFGVASVDTALGALFRELGEPDAARAALESGLAGARAIGDRSAEAVVLNNLAVLARSRGENRAARSSYEQVARVFEETGNRHGAALAATNLAICLTELGELDAALRQADAAIAIWREAGDRASLASALGARGGALRRRGDLPGAEQAWREALTLGEETGARVQEAAARNGLAQTLLEAGRLDEAAEEFGAAEALARELGTKSLVASALAGRSELAALGGEPARALALAGEALGLRRELDERVGAERLRLALARLDLVNDPAAASRVAEDLLAGSAERPPDVEAEARLVEARAALARGDRAAAGAALDAEGLTDRLPLETALDWRRVRARIAAAAGRDLGARSELQAVRRAAAAAGLLRSELEAAYEEARLADVPPAPEWERRAREAGYVEIAERFEALSG